MLRFVAVPYFCKNFVLAFLTLLSSLFSVVGILPSSGKATTTPDTEKKKKIEKDREVATPTLLANRRRCWRQFLGSKKHGLSVCLSPRPNWDSPFPLLQASVPGLPPPLPPGTLSPACEGVGESQFGRLEKKLCTSAYSVLLLYLVI
jgi:hypothetical protein